MYILTVEDSFSSAHQLRGYRGKCENIHGHNWRIILSVKGDKLNDIGLLIDFGDLRDMLKKITSHLDHKNLNDLEPFITRNPSSEIIAEYIATEADKELSAKKTGIVVESVTVWESERSRCTYYPPRK